MLPVLKAIAELLTPPTSPSGLELAWDAVEREIGLALPEDYKAFIDLYGTGQISSADGWAVIWNFRDSSLSGPSLSQWLNGPNCLPEFYRQVVNGSEWPCPYPIYPDPGGLLPFANIIDVDSLNWLTVGPAERWNVVHYACDEQEFPRLEGDSFSRCLLKILRQEYSYPERPSLEPPFEFTELDL